MHMDTGPRRHRITVHDYHRLAEVGVLAPDARVELIEGEIIDMAPLGKDHLSIVDQLNRLLVRAVGDAAIVRVQGSIRLSEVSEPEPDIVLLAPRPDFYRGELASGADCLLVIEVSDATLRYDRGVKVPLYARHGVPEYWIIDVQNAELRVYAELRLGRYERETAAVRPATAPITALPGVTIDLSGVFGA
jgi:Uma2 family endonuclease